MKLRIPLLSLLAVALVAAVLAGCGSSKKSSISSTTSTPASTAASTTGAGSASGSTAGGGQAIKLGADPGGALKFTTTTLHAKAGKVTIDLSNPSNLPHSVAVEGNGVDKDASKTAGPGGSTQVTVTLKKGTYSFYCPVPGHKAAGMKGTLIVS